MLEFAKMKEELEQARCPEHGTRPVIKLSETGFEFKEVCCDNFRKAGRNPIGKYGKEHCRY